MVWKDDEGLSEDLRNYVAQNLKQSEILKAAATRAFFSSRGQCNFKKLLHCRREEKIARVPCLALAMQHLLKSCRNIANS